MPAPSAFDYVVVRVVPRVDREEFLNVGVIVFSPARAFLGCKVAIDQRRLSVLIGDGHLDAAAVARHVEGLRAVCAGDPTAGPIARLSASERFHWLTAPRSSVIQTSASHAGLCDDPAVALERLFAMTIPLEQGSP